MERKKEGYREPRTTNRAEGGGGELVTGQAENDHLILFIAIILLSPPEPGPTRTLAKLTLIALILSLSLFSRR